MQQVFESIRAGSSLAAVRDTLCQMKHVDINDKNHERSALREVIDSDLYTQEQKILLCQELLEAGIDPNDTTTDGVTPLHASVGSIALCGLLIHFNADLLAVDSRGRLPEHTAEEMGYEQCFWFLINARIRTYPTLPREMKGTDALNLATSRHARMMDICLKNRLDRERLATVNREFEWNGLCERKYREILCPTLYSAIKLNSGGSTTWLDQFMLPTESVGYTVNFLSAPFAEQMAQTLTRLYKFVCNHPLSLLKSLNTEYGINVSLLGLEMMITDLARQYIRPLVSALSADANSGFSKVTAYYNEGCSAFKNEGNSAIMEISLLPDDNGKSYLFDSEMAALSPRFQKSLIIVCNYANKQEYAWKEVQQQFLASQCSSKPLELEEVVSKWLMSTRSQEELDSLDPEGRSLLHYSVLCGDVGSIRLLLQNNINPYMYDQSGLTAIHYCTFNDDGESLQAMLPYHHNISIHTLMSRSTRLVQITKRNHSCLDIALLRTPVANECLSLLQEASCLELRNIV